MKCFVLFGAIFQRADTARGLIARRQVRATAAAAWNLGHHINSSIGFSFLVTNIMSVSDTVPGGSGSCQRECQQKYHLCFVFSSTLCCTTLPNATPRTCIYTTCVTKGLRTLQQRWVSRCQQLLTHTSLGRRMGSPLFPHRLPAHTLISPVMVDSDMMAGVVAHPWQPCVLTVHPDFR